MKILVLKGSGVVALAEHLADTFENRGRRLYPDVGGQEDFFDAGRDIRADFGFAAE